MIELDALFFILIGIVLLSYITQALAGFGSLILAVTLGSHLYPIDFLLPVVVPMDVLVNTYIVTRHRRHVQKPVLFKHIFPVMSIGFVIGIFLFNFLHVDVLKRIFGLFVVCISIVQLALIKRENVSLARLSPFKSRLLIFVGGIVQGLYASGGPMVVYAVSRLNLNKSSFRSTLATLWLTLNFILSISYAATGKISPLSLKFSLLLIPVLVVGILIGERLHTIIKEKHFKVFIYILLLFAGLAITIR